MYKVCALILGGFAFLVPTCPTFADGINAKEEKMRLATSKPTYRVLYNQDDTIFFEQGGHTPQDVHRMVDEVADGGADVLLVNPSSQIVNYPSKVWQTYWEGYEKGDRSFFGVPEETVEQRITWVENMMELIPHGGYLALALAHCRERGITPGVSVRMNDMHDVPWPNSHVFSRFYRENPQLRLKPLDGRSWGAKGLDYAHREVREHYLTLIRELAEDYDIDVLELDFLRFPYYFSRDNIDQHCKTMTGFIREVRKILDGTDRHIALIPRIAPSPGAARQLGFDVQAWAREGLVDGITAMNFISTAWEIEIEQFRSLVGPEVAVYAGMEVSSDRRDGMATRFLPESYEMLRGFAAGHLAAGVDGVNSFNFTYARDHRPVTAEEFYGGLRQMRSLKDARSKPRVHVLSANAISKDGHYWATECDLPMQVPLSIRAWTERQFEMFLAAEGKGQKVQALVYFDGEARAEDLWLRIGLHYVGHAIAIREGPERKKEDDSSSKSKIAVFNVPSGVIKDGRNQLIIRSEKVSTTILGIDVHVR